MPAVALLAVVVVVATTCWLAWSTIVAFVGGDIPLTPFHLSGHDSLRGVAWLLTADPVALGVLATAISLALIARAERRGVAAPNVVAPNVGATSATPPARRPGLRRQLMSTASLTSGLAGGIRIAVIAVFTVLVCFAAFGWLLWTTAIAFVGGTIPLTHIHLSTSGAGIVRGLLMLGIGVPVGMYVLLLGYSLAVAAAAAKQMGAGLDAAAAHGQDVHTPRAWLRLIVALSFAIAVAAGLAWTYAT